ncbi:MAG: NADH-quinone oxidoreductase subunit F [Alphaproteobacteria bacterium]|jgi:formate dehydrogenase beta subunit|nr:NADH-quinone oxidoreductase subunit F [Alphaproteobacteria bacterium]MBT4020283.1 NADH-quinone oxidoreductase subunit F [Alphaproteobacteria bacterium]MBT4965444.1 NADH-quinone oxidoreductase subunit F [Alphaproteobacteria bacterium]MBT5158463.1 NADH-quinone oxidoreductase subunit F [Alphaproteobacteria bacterium]
MSIEKLPARKHRHPGTGKLKALAHPKGRGADPQAVSDLRALMGYRTPLRDELIEYLHLIQDTHHHISSRNLAALAEVMELSMAEVFETATFYAHFDVVGDEDTPPPELTIRVCDSLSCQISGAAELKALLDERTDDNVRVITAPCMGRCDRAPVVAVGENHLTAADAETIVRAVDAGEREAVVAGYVDLEDYARGKGYDLYQQCATGKYKPDDIMTILEKAGLRGLGGAGFPAATKWKFVRAEKGPRYLVVNADEGEPGTFKDRHYLESDPHRFLEGALIAAWAVQADDIYIYLRDEYPHIKKILEKEIDRLRKRNLTRPTFHLRRGAGAYICGEESALLESLEGKRGLPRHKPPFPAQKGLFGKPTLIHNVETLYWIRDLVEKGPELFTSSGLNDRTGLRSFSVSGHVMEPGVKLAPAGISVQELIDEHCGGMAEGHKFRAYLPGGASGGILPSTLGKLPLDFGTLEEYGCFIGSAAVIVLSDQDDLAEVAQNLMRFFEHESCGQCTPCRVGTEKAVQMLAQPTWDKPLLEDLANAMTDASICGLGQAACNPVRSLLKYFPEVGQ